ncbi:hypothetical protein VOLCADRAFT_105912 [Volvox carteri f. nagariensis]|uniref:Uncharacterized protein n=1 Tax=Volvox carteri f. nagariensis TaxID=3068 RepID=D8U4A6_VOLCA|nr:uncharacterized protein VOLCADRAFT_105912 [Volvox carteri f. nagariensis]EFJ45370.1 hypothetical protein VOLCADRAFT_105912 [Volvox carteri f. nagariensis]|eukprot:XP_002953397.1 hypothetical protein VOLCADRAFT_105912 [Volvox carteri f. nagariensis]
MDNSETLKAQLDGLLRRFDQSTKQEFQAAADKSELRAPIQASAELVNLVAASMHIRAVLKGGGSGHSTSATDYLVWLRSRSSTRALWLLGLPLVFLIFLQLFSCGPVCELLPVNGASYKDLLELFTEFRFFNPSQGGLRNPAKLADPTPMLIPRYMVILRLGGVYADIDVELRQPLDTVLLPTDTLVVGWEAEVATDAEAFKRHFVRRRQVLQWFFAAAPGHPVLRAACDHIARYARHTFSNNTNRDTLERTGPGMWTDAVLRHAAAHPPTKAGDPWKVRILPRVAFGVHPAGIDGLTPDAKEIVVLHHFLGSWKKRGGWHKRRSVLQILAGVIMAALQRRNEAAKAEEPITPSVLHLFPVSAAFNPPFTIMTHLIGQGDMQSGSDVSAHLTSWGTWQAAMSRPSRRPQVVEALVGALGPPSQGTVLVDVSAGTGFFSLAAAARGHKVVSFETSPRSIEAFSFSIVYNGFEDRIRLYNVSLGAAPSTLCLGERSGDDVVQMGGSDLGSEARQSVPSEPNDATAAATRRGYGDPLLHALPPAECALMTVRQTLAHMLMGSMEAPKSTASLAGPQMAQAEAHPAGAAAGASSQARNNGSGLLWDDALLPYQVGALRLSAHGWEGWILDGAESWLQRHRPGVVLLEYAPALVERSGYPGGGMRLLHRLHDLGYIYAAHTGYVCDERWLNITRALRVGGTPLGQLPGVANIGSNDDKGAGQKADGTMLGAGSGSGAGPSLTATGSSQLARPPTWCKLKPDVFQHLTDRVHPEGAENVLFIHQTHYIVRGRRGTAIDTSRLGATGDAAAAPGKAYVQLAGFHHLNFDCYTLLKDPVPSKAFNCTMLLTALTGLRPGIPPLESARVAFPHATKIHLHLDLLALVSEWPCLETPWSHLTAATTVAAAVATPPAPAPAPAPAEDAGAAGGPSRVSQSGVGGADGRGAGSHGGDGGTVGDDLWRTVEAVRISARLPLRLVWGGRVLSAAEQQRLEQLFKAWSWAQARAGRELSLSWHRIEGGHLAAVVAMSGLRALSLADAYDGPDGWLGACRAAVSLALTSSTGAALDEVSSADALGASGPAAAAAAAREASRSAARFAASFSLPPRELLPVDWHPGLLVWPVWLPTVRQLRLRSPSLAIHGQPPPWLVELRPESPPLQRGLAPPPPQLQEYFHEQLGCGSTSTCVPCPSSRPYFPLLLFPPSHAAAASALPCPAPSLPATPLASLTRLEVGGARPPRWGHWHQRGPRSSGHVREEVGVGSLLTSLAEHAQRAEAAAAAAAATATAVRVPHGLDPLSPRLSPQIAVASLPLLPPPSSLSGPTGFRSLTVLSFQSERLTGADWEALRVLGGLEELRINGWTPGEGLSPCVLQEVEEVDLEARAGEVRDGVTVAERQWRAAGEEEESGVVQGMELGCGVASAGGSSGGGRRLGLLSLPRLRVLMLSLRSAAQLRRLVGGLPQLEVLHLAIKGGAEEGAPCQDEDTQAVQAAAAAVTNKEAALRAWRPLLDCRRLVEVNVLSQRAVEMPLRGDMVAAHLTSAWPRLVVLQYSAGGWSGLDRTGVEALGRVPDKVLVLLPLVPLVAPSVAVTRGCKGSKWRRGLRPLFPPVGGACSSSRSGMWNAARSRREIGAESPQPLQLRRGLPSAAPYAGPGLAAGGGQQAATGCKLFPQSLKLLSLKFCRWQVLGVSLLGAVSRCTSLLELKLTWPEDDPPYIVRRSRHRSASISAEHQRSCQVAGAGRGGGDFPYPSPAPNTSLLHSGPPGASDCGEEYDGDGDEEDKSDDHDDDEEEEEEEEREVEGDGDEAEGQQWAKLAEELIWLERLELNRWATELPLGRRGGGQVGEEGDEGLLVGAAEGARQQQMPEGEGRGEGEVSAGAAAVRAVAADGPMGMAQLVRGVARMRRLHSLKLEDRASGPWGDEVDWSALSQMTALVQLELSGVTRGTASRVLQLARSSLPSCRPLVHVDNEGDMRAEMRRIDLLLGTVAPAAASVESGPSSTSASSLSPPDVSVVFK